MSNFLSFLIKNKKLIIIGVLVIFAVVIVFGLRNPKPKQQKIDLTMWGIFDNSDVWRKLIGEFRGKYPNINIHYIKKNFDTYEGDLINSMAAEDGPDIFIIPNNWVVKHSDKLKPAPDGSIGLKQYQDTFVDAVFQDFVSPNKKIFGIPLYMNSLVLYWNKDLFAQAKIPNPPKTWKEFVNDVQFLTEKDENGNIVQSGAAMGTAKNVNRACDILTLLMLQNGFKIIDLPHKKTDLNSDNFQKILGFYTDFANPNSQAYTWNMQQHYSIDAFAEGKVAMMFNYSYLVPILRTKEPYLNFGLSAFPQLENTQRKIYLAHYRGLVVSRHCQSPQAAWTFLLWLSQKQHSLEYLKLTQQAPARRDLMPQFIQDLNLGVVAQESINAVSWTKIRPKAIESLFNQSIDQAAINHQSISLIADQAIHSLNLMIQNFKNYDWINLGRK